jgi:peptide/nickel transport system substrate-binding protein
VKTARIWTISVSLVLVISLLVIGCSSSTTSTTTSAPISTANSPSPVTSSPSSTASKPPTSTASTAPASTTVTSPSSTTSSTPAATGPSPVKGGVLKIGAWPDGANIGVPSKAMNQFEFGYACTSLESIVRVDTKGNLAPGLATAWKQDAATKSITFTLRKGVKFHDGTDWNAQAAKWNLDQQIGSRNLGTASMSSTEIIDDSTVKLNLSRWDSTVIYYLAEGSIGLMISPAAYQKNGDAWAQKNPVGTGAFQIASWQKDIKQVYKKFGNYWQEGKPYLDEIDWVMIQDPLTKVASLQSGEVDVITEVDFPSAKKLEADGKYTVTRATPAFLGIASDSKNADSPFSKPQVRQALDFAIDKKAISESVAMGYWKPANQLAIPGSYAENAEVNSSSTYNVQKAKQLLEAAGFPNGFKCTLYMANIPPYSLLFPAVQNYLKAVNIDATLQAIDSAGYSQTIMMGGWKNGLTGIATQSGDAVKMLVGTYDPNSIRWGSKYIPPELWDIVNKASSAPDDATRNTFVQQAEKMVYDNGVVTWVAMIQAVCISRQPIQGMGLFTNATAAYEWTPANAWISK